MVKDKFGRTINAGDVVTYPQRRAGKMWMTNMKALAFENGKLQVEDLSSVKRRKSWTKNIDVVIRVGTENELQEGSTK